MFKKVCPKCYRSFKLDEDDIRTCIDCDAVLIFIKESKAVEVEADVDTGNDNDGFIDIDE